MMDKRFLLPLKRRRLYEDVLKEFTRDVSSFERSEAIKFQEAQNMFLATNAYREDIFSQMDISEADDKENFKQSQDEVKKVESTQIQTPSTGTWFTSKLDDYLSRPVHLIDFTVTNTLVNTSFNPWVLWSDDTSVRLKLAKYAYFKGDLELTFSFSSNKFNFGSLIVSYQPTPEFNPNYNFYTSPANLSTNQSRIAFRSYLLQSPDSHILNFSTDNNLVMNVPMIIPKRAVKLFNETTQIGNTVQFEEFSQLGVVHLLSLNNLADVVDDVPTPITIQVFARCPNFEMGPITDTPITVEAQSMESMYEDFCKFMESRNSSQGNNSSNEENADDEYAESGPISSVASAISKVGNTLSNVPLIGGAAQATSTIASGVSKVASIFGFSHPVNLEHFSLFKNFPFNNISFMDFKDTVIKHSSDPKQGLSISPFLENEKEDPLAINTITSKWGFINSFSWSISNLPRVTNIALIPLSPIITPLVAVTNAGLFSYIQETPLSFASRPFRFWKGTLSYRIQVIGSQVHRGKMAIVYEPNGADASFISSKSLEYNRQFLYIMDIEKERDIQIDVGFAYDKPFCRVVPENKLNIFLDFDYFSSTGIETLYNGGACMGFLRLVPFTSLNPNSLTEGTLLPINVNVFVKSDDIVYGSPYQLDRLNPDRSLGAGSPAREEVVESQMMQEKTVGDTNAPIKIININEVKTDFDEIFLKNFGEQIVSFRSLLNKAQIAYNFISNNIFAMNLPLYPSFNTNNFGNFSYPRISSTETNPKLGLLVPSGSFATYNLFNHLRGAFLYMSGGMRYRFHSTSGNRESQVLTTIRHVYKDDPNEGIRNKAPYGLNLDYLRTSNAGSAIFNPFIGGIEIEIPFYSTDWFSPANSKPVSDTSTKTFKLFQEDYSNFAIQTPNLDGPHQVTYSTAEDFNFHRFQGAPFYSMGENLGN